VPLNPLEEAFELVDDARYDEALAHLDAVRARDPGDPVLLALRALVLTALERRDEAAAEIARARELADDDAFVHYVAGEVALARGEVREAIEAARLAQALAYESDPGEAVLLEARARARTGQWPEVLRLAERVLADDADHEGAAVLAAVAREQDGAGPLDAAGWEALAERFPLNGVARSGRGWSLLEAGEVRAARGEFEQALALDPTLGWARDGMVLAMKARNPVYALLLRYFLWMSRLSERTGTMLVVGGVIGYNVLRRIARAQPELAPLILPLLVAYAALVLLTWLADPLLDLLLMARAEGRRLLRPEQQRCALLVGACLGGAVVAGSMGLAAAWSGGLAAATGLAFVSLTVAGAHQLPHGPRRAGMLALAATLAALALAAGVAAPETAAMLIGVVILGVVASTWVTRFAARGSARAPVAAS
jgi:tetratricopeptide (TPR) repeat protein